MKGKDAVLIKLKITIPVFKLRVHEGAANRGGKWVDIITTCQLRKATRSLLFRYGFPQKFGAVSVDIILNGQHVVLEELSEYSTRFTVRPS